MRQLSRLVIVLLAAGALPAGGASPGPAGICVHIGCGDGSGTAELAANPLLLVHGLAFDAASAEKARALLRERKLYGRASVDVLAGGRLPYADNLVNLVVVDDLAATAKAGIGLEEIVRVLCPGGRAVPGGVTEAELKAAAGVEGVMRVSITKPRPAGMDEWTQRGHDAGRSYVSRDSLVGPLSELRWLAGPYWPIGTNYQAGNAGLVTAGGRNFYATIHAAANYPRNALARMDQFHLVARDAYNGWLLWSLPVGGKLAVPPGSLPEQALAEVVVAVGDRVHTVLAGELVALDAATGKTVMTYEKGPAPARLLYEDGALLAASEGMVRALDPATGRERWKHAAAVEDCLAGGGAVFFITNRQRELVRLDASTGKQLYRKDVSAWCKGAYMNLACVKDGLLVFTHGKSKRGAHVADAADARHLWSYNSPGRICIFADAHVWFYTYGEPGKGKLIGLDPRTGKPVRTFLTKDPLSGGCCPDAATERFILGTRPLTTASLADGATSRFSGGRHPCKAGVVPANGLVYTMPQGCSRCASYSIRGFPAFAPAPAAAPKPRPANDPARLQKGPAFEANRQSAIGDWQFAWPTFRHDAQRSGVTKAAVPTEGLEVLWETVVEDQPLPAGPLASDWRASPLGGDRLTAPTAAGGIVCVGALESHRAAALDAATGKVRWTFTAGGRIDTPPTLHEGLALLGSADGRVYCLDAADGREAWRFQAAPGDRLVAAYGQLESAWPVVGGVLVDGGLACFVAGRTSASDGGVSFYALKPAGGQIVAARPDITVKENDLLVSDGAKVRLSSLVAQFNYALPAAAAAPMACLSGLRPVTDRSWHEHGSRSRQMDRKHMQKYFFWGHVGQLTVGDPVEKKTFAYKLRWRGYDATPKGPEDLGGDLMAWFDEGKAATNRQGSSEDSPPAWKVDVPDPAQVEALILAGEVLWAGGPLNKYDRGQGGFLRGYSARDGKCLVDRRLAAPPVSDGLAAADGRLFVATQDGKLLCLGAKK